MSYYVKLSGALAQESEPTYPDVMGTQRLINDLRRGTLKPLMTYDEAEVMTREGKHRRVIDKVLNKADKIARAQDKLRQNK